MEQFNWKALGIAAAETFLFPVLAVSTALAFVFLGWLMAVHPMILVIIIGVATLVGAGAVWRKKYFQTKARLERESRGIFDATHGDWPGP